MTGKRGTGTRWAAWAIVGTTAVLAVVLASRFGSDPALSESPLLGKPVPAVTVERLVGSGQVSLDSFDGKVLVVNFFASWCLECRQEHSALVATSDAFADQDVQFVGIAFEDAPADALRFLSEEG